MVAEVVVFLLLALNALLSVDPCFDSCAVRCGEVRRGASACHIAAHMAKLQTKKGAREHTHTKTRTHRHRHRHGDRHRHRQTSRQERTSKGCW